MIVVMCMFVLVLLCTVSDPCRDGAFTCRDEVGPSRCKPLIWVLDGQPDCLDSFDEGR